MYPYGRLKNKELSSGRTAGGSFQERHSYQLEPEFYGEQSPGESAEIPSVVRVMRTTSKTAKYQTVKNLVSVHHAERKRIQSDSSERSETVTPFPAAPPVILRPQTRPRPAKPSLNVALLYLLALIAVGVFIGRNKLWEAKLSSPLSTFQFSNSDLSIADREVRLPTLEIGRSNRVTHYMRSGEKFNTLFRRFGLDEEAGPKILKAIETIPSEKEGGLIPAPGRKVTFALSDSGELEKLSYPVSRDREVVVSAEMKDGVRSFIAKLVEKPPFEIQVVARGEIRTSFASAAQKSGIPFEITDAIVDLFSDRFDFRKDFQNGDRFTVIYRQLMQNGSPVSTAGPIVAVVFEINGKQLYALRYVGTDGKARYFDGEGKVLGESFLRFPLQFSKITSAFSDARFHPVLRVRRPHNGVDFAAPVGTPVRTVGDGQVIFAGYKGPNGYMVRIRHNTRFTTEYLHLSRISAGVRRGTVVSRGMLIGAVGSTGLSTGPHLHFGLFDRGTYVDPLRTKLPFSEALGRGMAIDRKYLSGLLMTLKRYQTEELEESSSRTVSLIERKRG